MSSIKLTGRQVKYLKDVIQDFLNDELIIEEIKTGAFSGIWLMQNNNTHSLHISIASEGEISVLKNSSFDNVINIDFQNKERK